MKKKKKLSYTQTVEKKIPQCKNLIVKQYDKNCDMKKKRKN